MPDYKKLEEQVHRLAEAVDQTRKQISEESETASRIAVLEEIKKCSESIDDRIDKRFKTAFVLVGVLTAILGAVGYLGLQSTLPGLVKESLGLEAKGDIERIRGEAHRAFEDIKKVHASVSSNPIIVLQTDYGNKAPYMGTLMGVIHSINPQARIETITSEIEDFDLIHAAWTLWRASRYYPAGTIFVAITNPGGFTRKPTVILANNGHIYVGHDNGCFDFVVANHGHKTSYAIASPELSPYEFQDLFGGVDIFGPTAARLSLGFTFDKIGPKSEVYKLKLPGVRHVVEKDKLIGTVMDVDKYGNCTTNVTESDLGSLNIRIGSTIRIRSSKKSVEIPYRVTYGNVSRGSPVAILYEGLLQLAVNEGSYAKSFSVARGHTIIVE